MELILILEFGPLSLVEDSISPTSMQHVNNNTGKFLQTMVTKVTVGQKHIFNVRLYDSRITYVYLSMLLCGSNISFFVRLYGKRCLSV